MWIAAVFGALLVVLILVDVFITVLSVSESRGPVERWLSRLMWSICRWAGRVFRRREAFATLCGPLLVVSTLVLWSASMVFGFALVYWPLLAGGIASSGGAPAESFGAALYFSGFTITTLGVGDLYPVGAMARAVTVGQAWLGFTFFTLTISYILSVYGAVRERNHLAASLDALSGRTGESCELFARLEGDPGRGTLLNHLRESFVALLTAHRQYPAIHYFRLPTAKYSTVRMFFLALDYLAIRQALSPDADASADSFEVAVEETLSGFMRMVLPSRHGKITPTAEEMDRWKAHLERSVALARQRASVSPDAAADSERYVSRRREWDGMLRALAEHYAGDWEELTRMQGSPGPA